MGRKIIRPPPWGFGVSVWTCAVRQWGMGDLAELLQTSDRGFLQVTTNDARLPTDSGMEWEEQESWTVVLAVSKSLRICKV